DDILRVHPGRIAAGDRPRRGGGVAADPRHRGIQRHARRHAVRPAADAGVLRGDPGLGRTAQRETPEVRQRMRPNCTGRTPAATRSALALVAALLGGCAAGPDYQPPKAETAGPSFANADHPE